jgi:alcohol dehydrogenase (NADP+)
VTLVGAPPKPLSVASFAPASRAPQPRGLEHRRHRRTQEMLDFCGQHNITADAAVIPIQKVNEACERLLKSDVKYHFSMHMASLRS